MSVKIPRVIAFGFNDFRLVDNKKRVALCKICGKKITDVITTTSNFVRHLKSHKESFCEYKKKPIPTHSEQQQHGVTRYLEPSRLELSRLEPSRLEPSRLEPPRLEPSRPTERLIKDQPYSPFNMTPPQRDLSLSIPPHSLTRLARDWLAEDTPNFDPAGVCVGSQEVVARLFCKSPRSVLAGSPFFNAVFAELGCKVDWLYEDGADLGAGSMTEAAVVSGPARCVLLGERPALNCLARASGIATRCAQLRGLASDAGWQGQVAGTRKTTPGFRLVEKYAMLVGGVSMHRQDLSGMVMLKDNHIWASGSITQAVRDARAVCGFSGKIEVECGSREEGSEAAAAGADIVMLDNFKPEVIHTAARLLKEEFPFLLIEASGGVTPSSLPKYLSPHVDIVSLGCITQGCPVVDFSLKVQKPFGF